MNYRSLAPLIALFAFTTAYAQTKQDEKLRAVQAQYAELQTQLDQVRVDMEKAKLDVMGHDLAAWGYPALDTGDTVIVHPGHALVWDDRYKVPKWTAHIIMPDIMEGNLARIDTFLPDPLVKTNTALITSYWYSGYDRGHMVPSADMRWSMEALKATYLYSNISPQKPELNRGSWADLEDWMRRYVHYSGHRVYVVTAPILGPDMPLLNKPKSEADVSAPPYFFKAMVDIDAPVKKGIAFVMSNALNDHGLLTYACSIDSVEKLSGLDLYPALDDTLENRIEAMHNTQDWYGEGDRAMGEVAPLVPPLPGGRFTTTQAKYHIGNKATICGTIVSTRRTKKANALYLNFDRMYPNQDFYATVWDSNSPNFSYDPETYLQGRKVCVTGMVSVFNDIARISINNEDEITFWEDVVKEDGDR
ncbi:MAG: DNA/RNA non-specific endonuclease [Flavobacteriales bacterium]|nr:DNA/RNA non-specific endonuclease [Flavobacteriales bacterium]